MERDRSQPEDAWIAILNRASTAKSFTDGLSLAEFKADTRTNCAVVYCLELIADASLELGPEARSRHPDVPWCDLIKAAEFYRRHYDRVSLDKVWRSLHERLPILVAAAEAELGRAPDR